MRADAKERQGRIEEQVALDWLAAQMHTMAGGGKLAPLDEWLAKVRPQPRRTVRDMILALQDAAARGAPIRVTQVKG